MDTKEKTKSLEDTLNSLDIDPATDEVYNLILWNDDVNSFQWVILCLMDILQYDFGKAEKTAWSVHNDGACTIKSGSQDELKPFKTLFEERGLNLTIEKN